METKNAIDTQDPMSHDETFQADCCTAPFLQGPEHLLCVGLRLDFAHGTDDVPFSSIRYMECHPEGPDLRMFQTERLFQDAAPAFCAFLFEADICPL